MKNLSHNGKRTVISTKRGFAWKGLLALQGSLQNFSYIWDRETWASGIKLSRLFIIRIKKNFSDMLHWSILSMSQNFVLKITWNYSTGLTSNLYNLSLKTISHSHCDLARKRSITGDIHKFIINSLRMTGQMLSSKLMQI